MKRRTAMTVMGVGLASCLTRIKQAQGETVSDFIASLRFSLNSAGKSPSDYSIIVPAEQELQLLRDPSLAAEWPCLTIHGFSCFMSQQATDLMLVPHKHVPAILVALRMNEREVMLEENYSCSAPLLKKLQRLAISVENLEEYVLVLSSPDYGELKRCKESKGEVFLFLKHELGFHRIWQIGKAKHSFLIHVDDFHEYCRLGDVVGKTGAS